MVTLIKYLAPYLPYDVLIASPEFKSGSRALVTLRGQHIKDSGLSDSLYKLVLRPIADITKNQDINGEKFSPLVKLAFEFNLSMYQFEGGKFYCKNYGKFIEPVELPYAVVERLAAWHFDIFGLIPQGEAVDLNTLKY